MNDATPPFDPSGGDPLEAIRREIDGIDQTLLALVAERLTLADRLGALKTDGLPIRPGREIALLRKLIAKAPQPLERELVIELWRALIAATLRRQRVVDVVVGGGRADPTRLFDVARRHFGSRTRVSHVAEPQAALKKAAENPGTCVAVTPWPSAPGVGAWWPALSELAFHKLHLIAALPLQGAVQEDPEAAVFAAAANEEAGGDISMLLVEDPHHRAQRALNELGLTGKEVARSEPRALVRVDGFIGIDDPRAGALARFGIDRVRVLGSYARI